MLHYSDMENMEAEVLVVGASLAGLCAAYAAARNGVETILIDAAPEIGSRPNPATVLMEPIWDRTELPIPQHTVEREFSGLKLGGLSGVGPLFHFRAVHLDRRAFDRSFAEKAAEAGTTIQSNTRVKRRLASGGVETDSGPVPARITIFADGANSTVRETMPTMRNPRNVAWGLDQLLEAPGIGESPYFEVRFGSFAPGWRAQFNPLGGDRASLWTFARGIPRDALDGYAERARRAFPGLKRVRVVSERRGVDPAFVVPGQLAGAGVMACGAAAGQGGLEYGARAGLLAGEVAARSFRAGDVSRHALASYEKAWKRETAAEIRALRWGMESLRHLSDARLNELFGTLSGVELDGEDLAYLLKGNPRRALGKVGGRRAGSVLFGLMRGWLGAVARRGRL